MNPFLSGVFWAGIAGAAVVAFCVYSLISGAIKDSKDSVQKQIDELKATLKDHHDSLEILLAWIKGDDEDDF